MTIASIKIVQVNVQQVVAPAPLTLQSTGAIVSLGGTNTAPGTLSLLTQASDFTPIEQAAKNISTLTYSAGTVTVTTSAPHGFTPGDQLYIFIAGVTCTGTSPNGLQLCTITGSAPSSSFTFPLASTIGTVSVTGTYRDDNYAEVLGAVTTFFAQGENTPVYIFECGPGTATDTVPVLVSWITNNLYKVYIWLCPSEWDAAGAFSTQLLAAYSGNTAKVYFFFQTQLATYTGYINTWKSGMGLVQSPSSTFPAEFSMAAVMWTVLNWNPSNINQVPPLQYTFVTDCTAYPLTGNSVILTQLLQANINWIGTGAEGGISNTLIRNGTLLDGNLMNYWYAVDAVQIHIDEDLANEIINGSNNPQNPLRYSQDGINRLQARAEATMAYLISWGLILGPVNVTAVPFAEYVTLNPTDYEARIYKGLAVIFTPASGFSQVIFNALVSQFPLGPA